MNPTAISIPSLKSVPAHLSKVISSREPAEVLTTQQMEHLQQCEAVRENRFASYYDIGCALRAIYDGRLYRATHHHFGHYCADCWSISRTRAWRLIRAAKLLQHLPPDGSVPFPARESHIQPLLGLELEAFVKAWKQVLRVAKNRKVTTRTVRSVLAEEKPAVAAPPKTSARSFDNKESWRLFVLVTKLRESDDHNETSLALMKEIEDMSLRIPAKSAVLS